MIKQPASIFNDVIGPVMRGPSSSHIAAAARIGELIRQMVKGNVKEVFVEFDPNGALATTYHGHGSDIGFIGGLLGYDPSDPELTHSLDEAANLGIKVSFVITEYGAVHPNTYKITVTDTMNHKTRITAISVGGGMIEIQLINDLQVNIAGDFYETLLFFNETSAKCLEGSINLIGRELNNIEFIDYSISNNKGLINIKTGYKLSDQSMDSFIKKLAGLKEILELSPVLPIMSRKNCIVPFNNADEMVKVGIERNLKLWELALLYERERGGISEQEVFNKMKEIVTILRNSIE
ncbi:MAG: serine dehydratase beta chain, partial [Bacillota bacterium]|nr:serine dehydratase beta chain [Bacillota bacterium]